MNLLSHYWPPNLTVLILLQPNLTISISWLMHFLRRNELLWFFFMRNKKWISEATFWLVQRKLAAMKNVLQRATEISLLMYVKRSYECEDYINNKWNNEFMLCKGKSIGLRSHPFWVICSLSSEVFRECPWVNPPLYKGPPPPISQSVSSGLCPTWHWIIVILSGSIRSGGWPLPPSRAGLGTLYDYILCIQCQQSWAFGVGGASANVEKILLG